MVRITTLADDYCFSGKVLGEHGLSVLLETGGKTVLFDAGQGLALKHNVETLGLDLSRLDAIVISHGHNDHTGGLKLALAMAGRREIPVFAHEGIFRDRVKKNAAGELVPSGIPFSRKEIEKEGANFILNSSPVKVVPGVMLSGAISRRFKETSTASHFVAENGEWVEDPFEDDQALVVETGAGTVIVFGCAHAGVINTMDHVAEVTGRQDFYALFGGTHLLNADDRQLEKTLAEIERRGVKELCLSHCTGLHSSDYLACHFSGRYRQGISGSRTEIE